MFQLSPDILIKVFESFTKHFFEVPQGSVKKLRRKRICPLRLNSLKLDLNFCCVPDFNLIFELFEINCLNSHGVFISLGHYALHKINSSLGLVTEFRFKY